MKLIPNFGLWDYYESFKNSFYEFKKSRKYEYNLKADILMVYPNSVGEWYQGLTDEGNTFLVIPMLLRQYKNLHPVYIEGKRTFIVSSEYHATLNLVLLGKIAERILTDFTVKYKFNEKFKKLMQYKWQYPSECIEFKIKSSPSTIDLTVFNNKYSEDFTLHSYKVGSTKALEFLSEIPRRVFILSLLLALGVGWVIGSFFTFIGSTLFYILVNFIFQR